MSTGPDRPGIRGILETSLYVDDIDRSSRFYKPLFGCVELVRDDRLCALSMGDQQVLLLFRKGASKRPGVTPGGTIPPHDGQGDLHMAIAISGEDIEAWLLKLDSLGIPLESRVHWPRGGTSLYFRDPDNHSIELATPGTWEVY